MKMNGRTNSIKVTALMNSNTRYNPSNGQNTGAVRFQEVAKLSLMPSWRRGSKTQHRDKQQPHGEKHGIAEGGEGEGAMPPTLKTPPPSASTNTKNSTNGTSHRISMNKAPMPTSGQ